MPGAVAAVAFTVAVASMAAAAASIAVASIVCTAVAVAYRAAVVVSKSVVDFATAFPSEVKEAAGSTMACRSAAKAEVDSITASPSAAGTWAKVGTAATTLVGGIITISG